MKHVALLLALLIFAFSLFSCGDLTYYKGAGWSCTQEEFYAKHYEATSKKIVEVANAHGINAVKEGTDLADDHFMIVVYDEKFTCYFNLSCEEMWGRITADCYFYGNADGSELADYSVQKKYVDFLNEITALFAYDMDASANVFEASYNNCINNEETAYEKVVVKDYMTGGVSYGVSLGVEFDVVNHTLRTDRDGAYKCNYFYFKGLIDGSFDNVHEAK